MNSLIFDTLKAGYLDSLTELDKLCFTHPWSKNMFSGDISNPNAHYVLVLKDNKVIAYCGLYKVLDQADITNIAVHPDYRQRGIAGKILSMVFEYCNLNNIYTLNLEVRQSNINAIKLYKKNGFFKVGERKNYYPGNRETAILMTKHIKEV